MSLTGARRHGRLMSETVYSLESRRTRLLDRYPGLSGFPVARCRRADLGVRDRVALRERESGGQGAGGREWSYYRCWLEALETVVVAEGLVARGEVERRAATLADRPADHDHEH